MTDIPPSHQQLLHQILSYTSNSYGVTPEQIMGHRRFPDFVAARWSVWSDLHEGGLSKSAIARLFGVDHKSVLYGIRGHRA